MPQGPVGRGCEACRAQKKKCDLAQPSCSRCQKLRITCTGGGQKRFKFALDKRAQSSRDKVQASSSPSHTPNNDLTHLQDSLLARLHHSNDVRYHMTFRWGSFLMEIPKRLGSSKALDAATAALLSRHAEACLRQDQTNPRARAMMDYNRALAVLRATLEDAQEASTTETLCAVMLLANCQARLDDQFTFFWSPHGQGIAQLLRMREFTSGRGTFETSLFGSLNATLLLQSFANPHVHLSEWEYRALENFFSSVEVSSRAEIRPWMLMIWISELMAHARDAIALNSSLEVIQTKAKELETPLNTLLTTMRNTLRTLEKQSPDTSHHEKVLAGSQRAYGVTLATSAILQCAQSAFSPNNSESDVSATDLCDEVLRINERARTYRPVGAVWTVHMLICTWCAVQDPNLKAKVQDALLDYQRDAMGPKAELQMNQLRLLEQRLRLLE